MQRESLALLFQEPLTIISRLRSGRDVPTDAVRFRHLVHQEILSSADKSRSKSFSDEDSRLATFAVVSLVDETILNLKLPAFVDWRRKPLGEEMFGVFLSGVVFFQSLDDILRRPDSHETADLMELYATCIFLGFQGRFSGSPSELKMRTNTCLVRIRRIRGAVPPLSPNHGLPASEIAIVPADPWKKRLAIAAPCFAVVAILLFASYQISLSSAIGELNGLTARSLR